MFDQKTLDMLHNNYLQTAAKPTAKPVPKKTTGRGGTLTSLISEGGALGGAATGAAIGSVVPVIGTAIGGIIGGGLGAFGGRLAENKVRDDRYGVADAAKEGALTTVLSGPLKLAKYGGTAAKLATKGGASLEEALTAAAAKTSAGSGVKAALGNKLATGSDNLATKALKLNGSQFNTDFANKTGEEVGQFATRFGLVGKNAKEINSKIYQPAQQVYSAAIKHIGDVPKADVLNTIKNELGPKLTSSFPEDKAFANSVLDQANVILNKYGKTIPATELNKLKSDAYAKVNKKFVDKSGVESNNLYDTLSNSFRKTIGEAADKRGIEVDPEVLKAAGLNFKSTKLSEFGNELNALNEISKKIDVASRVGKGSSIFGLNRSTGAVGGGVLGGPVGAVAGFAGSAVANSPKVVGAVTNGLDKASGKLLAGATGITPTLTGAVKATAKGAAGASLVDSIMGAGQSEMAPDTSDSTANNMNMPNASNIDPLSQDGTDPSSQQGSPYSRENLLLDIQRDPTNADKYIEYYNQLDKIFAAAAPPKMNATQLQQANNAQSGLDSLNTIAQTLQSNPNAAKLSNLPGGSLTSSLTGTGSYKAAINNATDVIGRLRSGGAINSDEEKRFMSLLPASFDDQNTVAYKLTALNNLFQSFVNPQQVGQPDGNDLAGALMQAGYQ